MSSPLYNTQSIKESIAKVFGIQTVHVPTAKERAEYSKKVAASKPASSVMPTEDDRAYAKLQAQTMVGDRLSQHGASVFFHMSNPGVSSSVGAISFDLVLSESHSMTTSVCSHPVQGNEAITDHLQPQPLTGSVKVLVTNYSLHDGKGGERYSSSSSFDIYNNRALDAYKMFKKIQAARVLVTMVTSLEVYKDVAIVSVSAPKDESSGDAITFDIEFKQIKRVQFQIAPITSICRPQSMASVDSRRATPHVSKGRVQPATVTADATSELGPL